MAVVVLVTVTVMVMVVISTMVVVVVKVVIFSSCGEKPMARADLVEGLWCSVVLRKDDLP